MKVQFKPEITLGNVLQILSILGAVIGYLIHNEVRATRFENQLASHETRIEHIETAVVIKKP